jgi:hypothetical protein
MNGANQSGDWYVDLIGVLLSSAAISYLTYLRSRDSSTGEIRNPKALTISITLIFGSYLLSYFLLLMRNDHLKINWILISAFGSLLSSIAYKLPLDNIHLGDVAGLALFFGLITLFLMGFVRIIHWITGRVRANAKSGF